MLTQYPPIKPYQVWSLAVSSVHTLYVEESGNPTGLPVLFIHGGPGAGASESDRCFFDPSIYRIVVFDQRGCGRSTPHASLEENTTQDLVSDIEKIRAQLKIDRWVLFGGSWGSTLSLVYAETYPEHVLGLILRGIFLCTRAEIDWFYGPTGCADIFADLYEDFIAPIDKKDRQTRFIEAYYELLTSDDEVKRMTAAKAWSIWEGRCCTLEPNHKKMDFFASPHAALSIARIESHYFKQDSFLTPNQVLENVHSIAHLPAILVQGRYDVICPFKQAWGLHKAWPNSQLQIIRNAGHSAGELGITDALIRATQEMAARLVPHQI